MVTLLSFIIATLEKITLFGTRGPFGDNVFKNPAGCIHRELLYEPGFKSFPTLKRQNSRNYEN